MDSKQIAKQIFLLSREKHLDSGYLAIQVYNLLDNSNSTEVMSIYEKIMIGSTKIVEVISKIDLSDDQKKDLEKKLFVQFSDLDLIFDYAVSERNKAGIIIKIGDQVLDGTI